MQCTVCGITECSACGATHGEFTHVYLSEDVCSACNGSLKQEATIDERKRIIAKARAASTAYSLVGDSMHNSHDKHRERDKAQAMAEFANELENETCE